MSFDLWDYFETRVDRDCEPASIDADWVTDKISSMIEAEPDKILAEQVRSEFSKLHFGGIAEMAYSMRDIRYNEMCMSGNVNVDYGDWID